MQSRKILSKTIIYGGLAVVMGFTLLPYLWLLVSTLKTDQEIFQVIPSWIPKRFTLVNYAWALGPNGTNLLPLLFNSILASGGTALLTGFFAATGGYALARYRAPGFKTVSVAILLSQMFQGPLIMVPWYKMAGMLGILNTHQVLILIYSTATIPIGVWLMRGFFETVPKELEEAASVDGCTKLATLFRIVLPLTAPGLVSIIIYSFILSWNDYQYALILTTSTQAKTVQVGIAELMDSMGKQNWGGIMASSVIVTIPIIGLFGVVQRYLIEGLTSGAVKG
ncbi:multiple sugar transport system permease protein/raffinose/stachyose/melibiose transport system permease protein [Hydrogenispora ethanolica]|jgi:ABC-type glycerol-3-phosphate transport system permease component|uniref:Multiple sugar transport system permease protein/raffinose/stachyose/melibiose transport system permease protein n=1 Tax=Hydrogenispora ethanolica TaxID=1082276 RepID=A0A4R1S4G0_HYDET|nr:carbohydrate ABC transporter permease [Hydrogenispora ethanolica]TCL74153.1 multiple sugar transport system permease protein/raffinose/stachyose/melibiose transport system permease protein [Hydrogenispora ethanolica]